MRQFAPSGASMLQRLQGTGTAKSLVRRWCCYCALFVLPSLIASTTCAQTVYSKSTRFRIPFQFDETELRRLGAEKIQLYVSTDQGVSWQRTDTVEPGAGKFSFEATQQGEHWFSVTTVTSAGMVYPPGPHQAGLKVLIDTIDPQLTLRVSEAEPGRARLLWTCADDNLDVNSLILEVLDSGDAEWKDLSVTPQESGETTWAVKNSGRVQVRGFVQDLAGNSVNASTETSVRVIRSVPDDKPDFSRPVANMPAKVAEPKRLAIPADQSLPTIGGVRPNLPKPEQMVSKFPENTSSVPLRSVSTPAETQLAAKPKATSTSTLPPLESPGSSVESAVEGLHANQHGLPPLEEEAINTNRNPLPPVKRSEHLVNTRSFTIGYEVDNVGPSGVSSVELYITENGGEKWFHYGSDPDKVSPFQVEVPGDGHYGFAIRVRNGVGLIATPPQPHDAPEIRVIVDRVPPTAKLIPVRQGDGTTGNQIVIEWQADDRELDAAPIALYYSHEATGPWELIQGWTKNTQRYLWNVPTSMDKRFYVRLEVRDAAGNVTRIDGDQPFMIDRSKPRARVTDVESVKPGLR